MSLWKALRRIYGREVRFLSQGREGFKCWKCGIEKKSALELFCESCKVLQSPDGQKDYFKLFGLKNDYDVDQKRLSETFRRLQSMLHPDKYVNKSAEEKKVSEEYSALVNKAYNILQSPINRGLHLLNLNNVQLPTEDDKETDPDFLMEIMELNEEVEAAGDAPTLSGLEAKNRRTLERCSKDLSDAFSRANFPAAKSILLRMKYYTSLLNRIATRRESV